MPLLAPLTGLRSWVLLVVCAAAIAAIGFVDMHTSVDTFVSQLYFVPLLVAARWLGTPSAVAMALLAGGAWIIADELDAHAYASPGVYAWNALSHATLFVGFAWMTARLSTALGRERMAARSDSLTGVNNRRAFFELGERALQRANVDQRPVLVLYFDLDKFKAVNDRDGHARGDEVLREFAAALVAAMRPHDVIGRIGGDEFAAFVIGVADGNAFLSSLREKIRAPIGFSAGVSLAEKDFAAAVKAADTAMYKQKLRA